MDNKNTPAEPEIDVAAIQRTVDSSLNEANATNEEREKHAKYELEQIEKEKQRAMRLVFLALADKAVEKGIDFAELKNISTAEQLLAKLKAVKVEDDGYLDLVSSFDSMNVQSVISMLEKKYKTRRAEALAKSKQANPEAKEATPEFTKTVSFVPRSKFEQKLVSQKQALKEHIAKYGAELPDSLPQATNYIQFIEELNKFKILAVAVQEVATISRKSTAEMGTDDDLTKVRARLAEILLQRESHEEAIRRETKQLIKKDETNLNFFHAYKDNRLGLSDKPVFSQEVARKLTRFTELQEKISALLEGIDQKEKGYSQEMELLPQYLEEFAKTTRFLFKSDFEYATNKLEQLDSKQKAILEVDTFEQATNVIDLLPRTKIRAIYNRAGEGNTRSLNLYCDYVANVLQNTALKYTDVLKSAIAHRTALLSEEQTAENRRAIQDLQTKIFALSASLMPALEAQDLIENFVVEDIQRLPTNSRIELAKILGEQLALEEAEAADKLVQLTSSVKTKLAEFQQRFTQDDKDTETPQEQSAGKFIEETARLMQYDFDHVKQGLALENEVFNSKVNLVEQSLNYWADSARFLEDSDIKAAGEVEDKLGRSIIPTAAIREVFLAAGFDELDPSDPGQLRKVKDEAEILLQKNYSEFVGFNSENLLDSAMAVVVKSGQLGLYDWANAKVDTTEESVARAATAEAIELAIIKPTQEAGVNFNGEKQLYTPAQANKLYEQVLNLRVRDRQIGKMFTEDENSTTRLRRYAALTAIYNNVANSDSSPVLKTTFEELSSNLDNFASDAALLKVLEDKFVNLEATTKEQTEIKNKVFRIVKFKDSLPVETQPDFFKVMFKLERVPGGIGMRTWQVPGMSTDNALNELLGTSLDLNISGVNFKNTLSYKNQAFPGGVALYSGISSQHEVRHILEQNLARELDTNGQESFYFKNRLDEIVARLNATQQDSKPFVWKELKLIDLGLTPAPETDTEGITQQKQAFVIVDLVNKIVSQKEVQVRAEYEGNQDLQEEILLDLKQKLVSSIYRYGNNPAQLSYELFRTFQEVDFGVLEQQVKSQEELAGLRNQDFLQDLAAKNEIAPALLEKLTAWFATDQEIMFGSNIQTLKLVQQNANYQFDYNPTDRKAENYDVFDTNQQSYVYLDKNYADGTSYQTSFKDPAAADFFPMIGRSYDAARPRVDPANEEFPLAWANYLPVKIPGIAGLINILGDKTVTPFVNKRDFSVMYGGTKFGRTIGLNKSIAGNWFKGASQALPFAPGKIGEAYANTKWPTRVAEAEYPGFTMPVQVTSLNADNLHNAAIRGIISGAEKYGLSPDQLTSLFGNMKSAGLEYSGGRPALDQESIKEDNWGNFRQFEFKRMQNAFMNFHELEPRPNQLIARTEGAEGTRYFEDEGKSKLVPLGKTGHKVFITKDGRVRVKFKDGDIGKLSATELRQKTPDFDNTGGTAFYTQWRPKEYLWGIGTNKEQKYYEHIDPRTGLRGLYLEEAPDFDPNIDTKDYPKPLLDQNGLVVSPESATLMRRENDSANEITIKDKLDRDIGVIATFNRFVEVRDKLLEQQVLIAKILLKRNDPKTYAELYGPSANKEKREDFERSAKENNESTIYSLADMLTAVKAAQGPLEETRPISHTIAPYAQESNGITVQREFRKILIPDINWVESMNEVLEKKIAGIKSDPNIVSREELDSWVKSAGAKGAIISESLVEEADVLAQEKNVKLGVKKIGKHPLQETEVDYVMAKEIVDRLIRYEVADKTILGSWVKDTKQQNFGNEEFIPVTKNFREYIGQHYMGLIIDAELDSNKLKFLDTFMQMRAKGEDLAPLVSGTDPIVTNELNKLARKLDLDFRNVTTTEDSLNLLNELEELPKYKPSASGAVSPDLERDNAILANLRTLQETIRTTLKITDPKVKLTKEHIYRYLVIQQLPNEVIKLQEMEDFENVLFGGRESLLRARASNDAVASKSERRDLRERVLDIYRNAQKMKGFEVRDETGLLAVNGDNDFETVARAILEANQKRRVTQREVDDYKRRLLLTDRFQDYSPSRNPSGEQRSKATNQISLTGYLTDVILDNREKENYFRADENKNKIFWNNRLNKLGQPIGVPIKRGSNTLIPEDKDALEMVFKVGNITMNVKRDTTENQDFINNNLGLESKFYGDYFNTPIINNDFDGRVAIKYLEKSKFRTQKTAIVTEMMNTATDMRKYRQEYKDWVVKFNLMAAGYANAWNRYKTVKGIWESMSRYTRRMNTLLIYAFIFGMATTGAPIFFNLFLGSAGIAKYITPWMDKRTVIAKNRRDTAAQMYERAQDKADSTSQEFMNPRGGTLNFVGRRKIQYQLANMQIDAEKLQSIKKTDGWAPTGTKILDTIIGNTFGEKGVITGMLSSK